MSIQNNPSSLAPVSSLRPASRSTSKDPSPANEEHAGDQVDFSAEADESNPYQDLAPYSTTLSPEAWSEDRTPAEGQVSRNDHLEGMLLNQGFSAEDIYAQDEQGRTMVDRVAEINDLEDPNLIYPDQNLVLPSLHPPVSEQALLSNFGWEVAETQLSQAVDSAVDTGALALGNDARADASTLVGQAVDSNLTTQATAVGENALAQAETEVGQAVDSTVETRALALGDAARADASTLVDQAVDSKITTQAAALGEDASAQAEARVGQAVDSVVATRAQAVGNDARADALTSVGQAVDSNVATQATAVGEQGNANALTLVEDAHSSTLLSDAVASGEGGRAVSEVQVGSADAETTLVATAQAPDGEATARAVNQGDSPLGDGQVSSVASENALAVARNLASARVDARSENGLALAVSDATEGQLSAQGPRASAWVGGEHTTTEFSLEGYEAVLSDGGEDNLLRGTARSRDLLLDTADSSGLDLEFTGLAGDNVLAGSLPDIASEENRAALNLGSGLDRVELDAGTGNQSVTMNKDDGSLVLNSRFATAPGDRSDLTLHAGDALVTGEVTGGDGTDVTVINGGRFSSDLFNDLVLDGGQGNNDQLTLELPAGVPVPAILTQRPRFLGWQEAQGAMPAGWSSGDDYLFASNYEHIAIRQNGQVVASWGG